MTLDWKEISQSEGYRSLKAAYTRDVQECNKSVQREHRPMRKKAEFFEKFQWVVSRAIHYAHHQSRSVSEVLTEWEAKRRYWWLNYYQECNQPWLVKSEYVKHRTLRNFFKKDYKHNPKRGVKHYFNALLREQQLKSNRQGNKRRWTKAHREYIERKKEWSKRT
jgi:hypothetical protein